MKLLQISSKQLIEFTEWFVKYFDSVVHMTKIQGRSQSIFETGTLVWAPKKCAQKFRQSKK